MRLAQALAFFLKEDRAPSTKRTYQKILEPLVIAIGPDRLLIHVSSDELTDYLAQLRDRSERYADHPRRPSESGGLSPATLQRWLKTVRAFFNYCVRRGWIAKSPAADVTLRRWSPPPGSSKALPADDLAAILEYVRHKRIHRERDFAIVMFLVDTGCRVGGCASLTLDKLSLPRRTATLREKGHKMHRVFFGEKTAGAIQNYLAHRPPVEGRHVWDNSHGEPLSAAGIAVMFRRAAIAAIGRSVGPHSIRHRVGQAWADAGVNPQLVRLKLGHGDVGVTLDHYFNQDWQRLSLASDELSLIALREAARPEVDHKVIHLPVAR